MLKKDFFIITVSFILFSLISVAGENYVFNASEVINIFYDNVNTKFFGCSGFIPCLSYEDGSYVDFYPVADVEKSLGIRRDLGFVNTYTNSNIPHDISILNVFACVKAQRAYDFNEDCFIMFGENSSGAWNWDEEAFNCNIYPYTALGVKCVNASDFFNLTKLNSSGVGFKIDYWRYAYQNVRNMYLDWLYLNISYIPLQFISWGANSTTLMRGESVEIYAKWQIKDIANAKIMHNFSGSFQEYSLSPQYPWTNYTVIFSTQSQQSSGNVFYATKPGYYEISYIQAQDSYGGYNKTFPSMGINLLGYSEVNEIGVNDSYVYPTESVKAHCKVVDANTSEAIESYPVNFYLNETLVGMSYTNSSGYASHEITIPSVGVYEIKCNITNNSTLYYNVSSQNEKNIFVRALNLSVKMNLNSSFLQYSEGILVKANITNASSIISVDLNHSFTNITDSCTLENAYTSMVMNVTQCYSPYLCEAELSFVPKRSGNHNLTLCVNASSPYGTECTFSNFSVSFGEVSSVFWIPYYFVLVNQTFNITTNVTSKNGDVWNVNISLNIDGKESINLTSYESWWKSVEGVKNSSVCLVRFSSYSNTTGLVRMTLNSLPKNGSSSRFSESFEVIEPGTDKNSNISFSPQSIYIDGYTLIKANIIGNATPAQVNFTVVKSWGSGNENFVFQKVEALDPEFCGIVFESGNIASLTKGASASASAGNDTAYYAIDEDNSTAWSWGEAAQINVTFKKLDYAVERIELRWKKLVTGEVNASIYYIDPLGALNTFAENIQLSSNVNDTIFADFKPFKAGKLVLNFTGAASVYEVRVYPTIPRSDKCYVFSVNYTSENLTFSGYYNTFASIITAENNLINLKNASFFVNYGKPLLEISQYTPEGMILGSPEKYIVIVTAHRGDLRNFTLRWNSSEQNYLNITPSEKFMKNFTFLLNGNSTEVIWIINATDIPSGVSNYTVETFVDAFSDLGRVNENSNVSFNITIYPEDKQAPVINSFWFEISGIETNKTNFNFSLSLLANVTDNIWVRYVNATVVYPNGSNYSISLRKISDILWNYTFTVDGIELNETGIYEIRVEAADLEYNETISNFSSLNVTDTLYIVIESPTLLNRGEYLNLSARDVNNLTVKNVLFNFSATAENSNFTINNSEKTDYFLVFINSTFPGDVYLANVSVKIYNNTGKLIFNFTVSPNLLIEIIAPVENAVFQPGSAISGVDLPRAKVYNVRGDREIKNNVSVNVTCLNSSFSAESFEVAYGDCGVFPDTFSFSGCVAKCYAPNTYSSQFSISFSARDLFNNTGVESVILKTITLAPSGGGETTPSGGGGGVAALPAPVCNCTEWRDIGCGISFCGLEEMYQERICTPSNCSIETRCIKHTACIISPDFEITYLNTTTELVKGVEKTFYLIISNLVNKKIEVNAQIEAECCKVEYEKTISLEPKMEKLYEIKLIPFLNASEYSILRFNFSVEELRKEGSIELFIKENPVVERIEKMKSMIPEFLRKIEVLKRVGVNVEEVEKDVEALERLINKTSMHIEMNDLKSLEASFSNIKKISSDVEKKLREGESKIIYAIISKNAHWIILSAVVLVYIIYLVINVLFPYLRYKKMLKKFIEKEKELVKARIETEKQFFMRKIDEKTFRELIVKRQHEIISTRVKIKELKSEMQSLIRESISPVKMIFWVKETLKKLPKALYNKLRKIKEYGEDIYWRIRFR